MALDFFRKRAPEQFPQPEVPPQMQELPPPPVNEMRTAGMPSRDIVRDLTSRGYPSTDILSGFQTPASSPANYPEPSMPMPPAPPPFRFTPSRPATEEVQEIAETIVAEKWKESSRELESIKKWRDETESAISNLSDRMTKLEMKMDSVEQAILGKVEEYGKSISNVGTELKAMQRVFQTTMPAFTENIKELQGLVDETKSRRRKK